VFAAINLILRINAINVIELSGSVELNHLGSILIQRRYRGRQAAERFHTLSHGAETAGTL
jgi:hypothetical protein